MRTKDARVVRQDRIILFFGISCLVAGALTLRTLFWLAAPLMMVGVLIAIIGFVYRHFGE